MAVSVGDVVRIAARFILGGTSDITNVYHFNVTRNATADDVDFGEQACAYLEGLYAGIAGLITLDVTGYLFELKNITQDLLLPDVAWVDNTPFTAAGDPYTAMTAPLVYFPTAKSHTQCRLYLPPPAENQITDGAWASGNEAIVLTAFVDLVDFGLLTTDIDGGYIAYSREFGTETPVSAIVVPSYMRTQRRRRPNVGS